MKSYNYKIINNSTSEIIDFQTFKKEKNILIQIFCGQGKEAFEVITKEIQTSLPQAICIGSTTDGEILNNEVLMKTTVVNISVFEDTQIDIAYSSKTSSYERGVDLANKLVKDNTKLLILFSTALNTNGEDFLDEIGRASCRERVYAPV